MLSEPQKLIGFHTYRCACRTLFGAMLKIALALVGKWRIAVPATGGLAEE